MAQPIDQEKILAEEAPVDPDLKAREERADLLLRAWRQVQLAKAGEGAKDRVIADEALTVAAD